MDSSITQQDFAYYFLSVIIEGAPYILLGTLISGFIDVYMPSGLHSKVLPKKKVPAILVCGFLGIFIPVCECAVVPVIRRLVAKGLPVSCAFTYMLAAPVVNPITWFSTATAFSGQQQWLVTWSRMGLGYLVAVTVGMVLIIVPIERILRDSLLKAIRSEGDRIDDVPSDDNHDHSSCGHSHTADTHSSCSEHTTSSCGYHVDEMVQDEERSCGHDDSCNEHHHHHDEKGSSDRLVAAMRSAMRDFVDVGVYFSIGVCLTVLFNLSISGNSNVLASLAGNEWVGTATMMGLAFILSVCSTSDAFMAATLHTFSYGAKMAFMVFGPMLDVKLVFLYQTVMRGKFLWILGLSLFVGIGLLCIGWQTIVEGVLAR